MDPALAAITLFAGNFAPQGWAICAGQLLPINQNQALFSLLGTTYGGNGQTTFALPDMRGRSPVGTGAGPGLSNIILGQVSGVPSVTLLSTNLPLHTHTATINLPATSTAANTDEPEGNIPAAGSTIYGPVANASGNMAGVSATVENTGGGQTVPIRQPHLAINFIIALQGIFPSRN